MRVVPGLLEEALPTDDAERFARVGAVFMASALGSVEIVEPATVELSAERCEPNR